MLRSVSEYYRRLHANQGWQRNADPTASTSEQPQATTSNTAPNDDVSFVSENQPPNNAMPLISVRVPRINIIRRAISPDRVYRPHSNPIAANNESNPNPTNTAEPAAPENTPSTDFSSTNRHTIETPTTRPQPSTRYPYMVRRLSTSSFLPNNSHLRPAYAPHETLWNRQQLNQEIHRRHMMNGMSGGISNDSMPPNTFTSYPNRANLSTTSTSGTAPCQTCHNQHPVRRLRSYLRPWSTVSCRLCRF